MTYQQTVKTALREVEDALVFRAKSARSRAPANSSWRRCATPNACPRRAMKAGSRATSTCLDAQQDLYEAQDKQVGATATPSSR